MRTTPITMAFVAAVFSCFVGQTSAQVRVLDDLVVSRVFDQLREVDFEDFPSDWLELFPRNPIPNPLVLGGVTFRAAFPHEFRARPCGGCEPDQDNPRGGNNSLHIPPGARIEFEEAPKVVVLEFADSDDNLWVLFVNDSPQGIVLDEGRNGGKPLGLSAPPGIRSIRLVQDASGSQGAINLARVLFAREIENNCPIAHPQNIRIAMDSSVPVSLTGFDTDADPLFYTASRAGVHGTITGVAPNLIYTPDPGYTGPDIIQFRVDDGICFSPITAVTINIVANECPIVVAEISPNLILSQEQANVVTIAGCEGRACLRLDGSQSSDPDGDLLNYDWSVGGVPVKPFGAAVAITCLKVGSHKVTLTVDDGLCSATSTIGVEVITPVQGVEILIQQVTQSDLHHHRKRSLFASLKVAESLLDRNRFGAGRRVLNAFIRQVHAQVGPKDSDLAVQLIRVAEEIRNQTDCDKKELRPRNLSPDKIR